MLKVVLLLFCLVIHTYSASAPFITPCKPGDRACYKSSAQAAIPYFASGVPELGIKPMDPMNIALIQSDHGGLQLKFTDTSLTGLRDCDVQDLDYDSEKAKQTVTLKCSVTLIGDYSLDGKLLILAVKGNGKYKVNLRDLVLTATLDLKNVNGKDGQPHWHIKRRHHTYEVLAGATFDFENLFNGNKDLAQPVLDFVNTNWKDVMSEVAPPVVDAIVKEVVEAVEALYKAVPSAELMA